MEMPRVETNLAATANDALNFARPANPRQEEHCVTLTRMRQDNPTLMSSANML